MSEHAKPLEDGHGAEAHGLGHVMPIKILVGVFTALIVLTGITVAVSYVDFGEFNLIVAMAIAVVKGSLVCMFFMHLLYDNKFNMFVFLACLVFVGLFISFAMLDSHQYRRSVRGGQAPLLTGDKAPTYAPEAPPASPPAKP